MYRTPLLNHRYHRSNQLHFHQRRVRATSLYHVEHKEYVSQAHSDGTRTEEKSGMLPELTHIDMCFRTYQYVCMIKTTIDLQLPDRTWNQSTS